MRITTKLCATQFSRVEQRGVVESVVEELITFTE